MAKRASIAKNAVSLLASRVVGALVTVVLVAIVARSLGTDGFGRYTFALSVGAILSVIADFGLSYLIPREVAQDKSKLEGYLMAGCVIKAVFSAGLFLLLVAILPYFYSQSVRYAVYAAFAMFALRGLVELCISFFNAFERMHYSAALYLMCHLGVFGAGLAAVWVGVGDAWRILLAQACAMIGFVGFAFLLTFKLLRPDTLRFDRGLCMVVLKQAVPFGLFAIGGIVYFQIDNVLMSAFRNFEEIGFYQAAIRLIVALEMLPLVFSNAIYPTISRVLRQSKQQAVEITEKVLYLMLIIGVPIGVTTTVLAHPIVSFIFGNNYAAVVPALTIVAWLVPIRFCGHILGTLLSASGNQEFRTLVSWLSVAVNVAINLVLLPRYGYIGAAIASVATSLFLVTFYYVIVYLRFYRLEVFGAIIKLALPTAVLLMSLRLVCQVNLFLATGIGLALYCVMLATLGVFTKEQILAFGKLLLDKTEG